MTEPIPSPWYRDGKIINLGPEPEKKEEQEEKRPNIFFEFSDELRDMMKEELDGKGFVYIVMDDSIPCTEVKEGKPCKGKHDFIGWSMNIAPEEVMKVVQQAVKLFDIKKFRGNGPDNSAPAI